MNDFPQQKPLVKSLPLNSRGRDFVVSDIHGHIGPLISALTQLKFDPAKDRVLFGGDAVDRGPNSYDALLLYKEPWFYGVEGNHERMLVGEHRYGNIRDFATRTIHGGLWSRGRDGSVPFVELIRYIDQNVPFVLRIGTPTVFVVAHAEVITASFVGGLIPGTILSPYHLADDDIVKTITGNSLLWGRRMIRSSNPHTQFRPNGPLVPTFVGHTPIDPRIELPCVWNHIYIDGGCGKGGDELIVLAEPFADQFHVLDIHTNALRTVGQQFGIR